MAEISLAGQILAVEREIKMRKAVYKRKVADKAMMQETSDYEIAAMTSVLATLRRFEGFEKALRLYGDPKNWRYGHDEKGRLAWETSLGPNVAINALDQEKSAEQSLFAETQKR